MISVPCIIVVSLCTYYCHCYEFNCAVVRSSYVAIATYIQHFVAVN